MKPSGSWLLVAALATAALAQEPTGRAVTGSLPLVGDREIFQPGTQPCTVPGYAPSCFHTDHTDEIDRKFHPAQGELSKIPPLNELHPTANAIRAGDLPVATDGTELPKEELVCANCHGNYPDGRESAARAEYSPYDTWKGTMMAQAWRDPLARAAIAVANHGLVSSKIDYSRGVYDDGPRGREGRTAGDYCIRCHSPIGWLEGNSLPADGSRVQGKQMDGVQCDACHRMVNPLTHTAEVPDVYRATQNLPDSLLDPSTKEFGVAELHNGNFIVNTTGRKIGPYADPVDLDQHPLDAVESAGDPAADPQFVTAADENLHFVRNSQFCAVCHNVTNPILNRLLEDGTPVTVAGRPEKMPVERTYTEWYFSDFGPAAKGDPNQPLDPDDSGAESCQGCHMPELEGYAANPFITGVTEKGRRPLRQHVFVGGNAWAQDMIPLFFPDQAPLIPAFETVQEMARENLRQAATLQAALDGTTLRVNVVNESGHKLPTGYPEGRRMWLEVVGYDAGGTAVYESGAYDDDQALLSKDADLKVWAADLGVKKPGIPAEKSFHFILNNVVLKDNRIPPTGFDVARASEHATVIVRGDRASDLTHGERDCRGYEVFPDPEAACHAFDYDAADGKSDGTDVVFYELPAGVESVRVRLRYQTASREYIEFLSDPLSSGDYYDRFTAGLKAAWMLTGMSPPVDMQCATAGPVPAAGNCPDEGG